MTRSLRSSLFAPLALLASLVSGVALAGDAEIAQYAAEDCQAYAGGWLSCEPSRSGDLDCTCEPLAGGKGQDAYFVRVDRETTTQAFDGKLLVAHDLSDEQSATTASIWIDARATPAEIAEIDGDFVRYYREAVDAGLPSDLAAEEAAERSMGDTMTHEVGHWMGLSHTH